MGVLLQMSDYFALSITLYHRGDFYEAYHSEAHKMAEVLSTAMVIQGDDGVHMTAFPAYRLNECRTKIEKAGIKVKLEEKHETIKGGQVTRLCLPVPGNRPANPHGMKNAIATILKKKENELPEKTWSLGDAERVFFGEESPTPYEEWLAAGEFIIEHGDSISARDVKRIFGRPS